MVLYKGFERGYMMRDLYDGNRFFVSRMIDTPHSLDRRVDYERIDPKYRDMIFMFHKKLSSSVSDGEMNLFYNNINTLTIRDKGIKTKLSLLWEGGANGIYSPPSNSILLKYSKAETFDHELLHMSSAYYYKKENRDYCGFSQIMERMCIGFALNEGYTAYLNKKIFDHDSEFIYDYCGYIAYLLGYIVGEDVMRKTYFNADLYGLVMQLEKYNQRNCVINFLYKLDYIFDQVYIFVDSKVRKYLYDVNFFLFHTYTNKLTLLYNRGVITIEEASVLFDNFEKLMMGMLDLDFNLNKDKTTSNIKDNAFIFKRKIKALE